MKATRFCPNCKTEVDWMRVRPVGANRAQFSCISCGAKTKHVPARTKILLKECLKCSKEFEIRDLRFHRAQKGYCSEACAKSHHWEVKAVASGKSKIETKKGPRYGPVLTCQCGAEFVAPDASSKYCSKRCGKKYRLLKSEVFLIKHFGKKLKLQTLDVMAREICRRRVGCEANGEEGLACKGSLQWAHIISRTYHKTRWDDDNCLYLCAAHHTFYTYYVIHWREFLKRKIGQDKVSELERRALADGKVDRIETYKRLRAELKTHESTTVQTGRESN